jgi:hypothetical protein
MDILSTAADHHHRNANGQRAISMGDKSPKAKDKSKRQHTADKNQKQAAAVEKAKHAPTSTKPGKGAK